MQLTKYRLLVRISKLPNNALSFPIHQFLEMVLLQMTVQQKKCDWSHSTHWTYPSLPARCIWTVQTLNNCQLRHWLAQLAVIPGQPAFWQPQTSFPLLILLPSLSSCLLNFGLYITADRCFPRGDKKALAQSLSDSFQAAPHQGSDRWAVRQVGKQLHSAQLQAFLEGKEQSISRLHSAWHYPTICKVHSDKE